MFYIKEDFLNEFQNNEQNYEDAKELFIEKNYIDEIDFNDSLSINEDNDQYRSYSSTTSDIDESYEGNETSYSNESSDDGHFNENNDNESNDVSLAPLTFPHGAIDYVDVRTNGNKNLYINTAPKIPDDKDQRPSHVKINLNDEYIKKVSDSNNPANESSFIQQKSVEKVEKPPKRLYVKTTETQRSQLVKLFNIHQDTWPIEKYVMETGIREKNCKRLLKKN